MRAERTNRTILYPPNVKLSSVTLTLKLYPKIILPNALFLVVLVACCRFRLIRWRWRVRSPGFLVWFWPFLLYKFILNLNTNDVDKENIQQHCITSGIIFFSILNLYWLLLSSLKIIATKIGSSSLSTISLYSSL